METLPYEVLVRIACKLGITAIFRFSLATSRRGNILFLEDERLFRILCSRDYDHDEEKPWSWKESYKALTVFANYMIGRCREIKETDGPSKYHNICPEKQVMMKFFKDNEGFDGGYDSSTDDDCEGIEDIEAFDEPYFRSAGDSCILAEDYRPIFLPHYTKRDLVDLRNAHFQHSMVIERLRIRYIDNEEQMDWNEGFFPPKRQHLVILKEGLCRWLRVPDRSACNYVLLSPMEKCSRLYYACEEKATKLLNDELDLVNRILAQKITMIYKFSDNNLMVAHSDFVWKSILQALYYAELHVLDSKFSQDSRGEFVLTLILVRKPRWETKKKCIWGNCDMQVPEQFWSEELTNKIPDTSDTIRLHNCCQRHSGDVLLNGAIPAIMKYRVQLLNAEKRQFLKRRFRSENYCDLPDNFPFIINDGNRVGALLNLTRTSFTIE